MPFSLDMSSDIPTLSKIEKQNEEDSNDYITDYSGSGEEDYEIDGERIVEYFDCFKCKKRSEYDEDCYFIEDVEETGELISALCGKCKEILFKPCIICEKDFDSDDNFRNEVRYLFYNFGKLEKCISCRVTSNDYVLKPNIEDLEIGNDNSDYKSINEELTKNVYKLLKENDILENDKFLQFLENYKNNNLSQNLEIKLDESKKYKFINKSIRTINTEKYFNEIDFTQYKIGDKIIYKNNLGNNSEIIIHGWCLMCIETPAKGVKDYCKSCNKARNGCAYHVYKGNKKICKHCYNLFDKSNEENIYCNECIIYDNKNQDYNFSQNIKINLLNIKLRFEVIEFRKNTLKYLVDKKKLKKQRNNLLDEINTLKSDIKNLQIFKIDFDGFEKEYENALKAEREEQIKKVYEKLKQNKLEKNNKNNENNIYKLFNKLDNQKYEKLYILADIGKELKDNNIDNETKFLEQFKDNDIYYIYDLKSKNKISRFINMCNKLYMLKDKVKLENIIKNNLLTYIRDLSQNNFKYLLSLF